MPFPLNELKELEAKANRGPWNKILDGISSLNPDSKNGEGRMMISGGRKKLSDENLHFIVALRNAFPEIVKRLEAAQALVEALECMHFEPAAKDYTEREQQFYNHAMFLSKKQRDAALEAFKKAIE